MRAQSVRTALAWCSARSGCWQSLTRSAAAQNFSPPLPLPVARHPAGSGFRRHPAASPCPRSHPAQSSAPSRPPQTAPPCGRAQTRTNGQTSTGCSKCEQRIAPLLGYRSPFLRIYPPMMLLTTLELSPPRDKPPSPLCHLVYNTAIRSVLATRPQFSLLQLLL